MVMPPLGLWYIGAALKLHGFEVEYCDRSVDKEIPYGDVYGVTGTSPQSKSMRQTIGMLAKRENSYVVAGGPHATLFPHRVRDWGADAVVAGEGEVVGPRIMGANREGIINAPRVMGLDGLPFPDRSDAERYHYELNGRKATTMMTSRGCPFECAFCSHGLWGKQVRMRSASNVLHEVKQLKDMGYQSVMFYDDTFTLHANRTVIISQGLGNLGLTWRCFIRADRADVQMLKAMRDGGCEEVGLGVESGSQAILNTICKKTTVKQNAEVIDLCKRLGISVKAFIIVGLPGESWETVEETRAFLREHRPDRLDVCVYVPMPGTPITDNPKDYDISWNGRIRPETMWYKTIPGEYESIVSTSRMTAEEIVRARDLIAQDMGLPY
jgi:anaerobic magnesium-protoporphyrin IX monomethyl ester cyclase